MLRRFIVRHTYDVSSPFHPHSPDPIAKLNYCCAAPTSPRYNIRKLQDPAFQQGFAVEVSNRFSALSEDEIGNWSIFKTELNSVATKTIGLHKPPKKEWLSPRTLETVEMKRTARLEGRLEDYKRLSAQCKDDILADKQKWADDLATEAELALNKGQVKDAFANLRRLRSACPRISSPISLVDGTLVSDKPQKLQRWKEYYSELLNRPSAPPSCELQEAAAQANPDVTIDCAPPSSAEVQRAIHRLKDGKAPGLCNITAEMLKAAGPDGIEWLTAICRTAWEQGIIPEDWRKGVILPFYKGKGSRHDCHNYRGITLLSVPGKVFAHVLIARVKNHLHSLEIAIKELIHYEFGYLKDCETDRDWLIKFDFRASRSYHHQLRVDDLTLAK